MPYMFQVVSPPIIRSSKTVHTALSICQACLLLTLAWVSWKKEEESCLVTVRLFHRIKQKTDRLNTIGYFLSPHYKPKMLHYKHKNAFMHLIRISEGIAITSLHSNV